MIPLTQEQREYKEKTLAQLLVNQPLLESRLHQESRPDVVRSIQEQLEDIETHISRLQDELAGNIVFDEPVADELFRQAARALAREKFFLAKKHVHRLETIEPFYPGIERLKQEAESGRVSRRTRSIAQGVATSYPGMTSPTISRRPESGRRQSAVAQIYPESVSEGSGGSIFNLFQFHIIISCLVVILIICVLLAMGSMTIIQWLVEGGL